MRTKKRLPLSGDFELFHLDLNELDHDMEIPIEYFKNYLLPAVQKYLSKSFEKEKIKAIKLEILECKKYIDECHIISTNNLNRKNQLNAHVNREMLHDADREDEYKFSTLREKTFFNLYHELEKIRYQFSQFCMQQPGLTLFIETIMRFKITKHSQLGNCQGNIRSCFSFFSQK